MSGALVYEREVKKNITAHHLIDTGKMRAAVAALVIGANKVIVAVRTFYAIFHEFGTRRLKARPFLRPPMDTHKKEIQGAIVAFLAKELKGIIK